MALIQKVELQGHLHNKWHIIEEIYSKATIKTLQWKVSKDAQRRTGGKVRKET